MITGARCVVTGRARALQCGDVQVIVEALYPGDYDGLRIEQSLAAGHRAPCLGAAPVGATAINRVPRVVELEHVRVEGFAGAVVVGDDIVDTEVEVLLAQNLRSAQRMPCRQLACLVIEGLRGEERGLEGNDRLALRSSQRLRRLGVSGGC